MARRGEGGIGQGRNHDVEIGPAGDPAVLRVVVGALEIVHAGGDMDAPAQEIGGRAAIYFDPSDRSALRDALRRVLSDSSLRARLQKSGPLRAGECRLAIVVSRSLIPVQ